MQPFPWVHNCSTSLRCQCRHLQEKLMAHLIRGVGVKAGSWLIQEKHTGLGHQGNANVHTLALTTCTKQR